MVSPCSRTTAPPSDPVKLRLIAPAFHRLREQDEEMSRNSFGYVYCERRRDEHCGDERTHCESKGQYVTAFHCVSLGAFVAGAGAGLQHYWYLEITLY